MNELALFTDFPTPRIYQGQRVLTLRDVDEIHKRAEGTARRNFSENRSHLIENIDYFRADSRDRGVYENRTGGVIQEGTTLLTVTGYLMVVKSFHDDLSWDIQRELVRGYFAGLKRGLTYHGTEVVTIGKYCEATGENPRTISGWIRAHEQELPLQSVIYIEGRNLRCFREENPQYEGSASSLYILTRQGAEIIRSRKRKVLTA